MTNPTGENAIKLLTLEYDYISKYNSDPDNLITPDTNIITTEFNQNDDSTWSKVEYETKNPNELPSTVISKEVSNREQMISDLKEVAKPLDIELKNINDQINSKKSQIISTITSAVSAGCSSIQYGITLVPPFITLLSDAADVNGTGVAIGVGVTVRGDVAAIGVYTNIENYSANSFSPIGIENLSSSNLGDGYETLVLDNEGSIISTSYSEIDINPIFPPPNQSTCISYYNTITNLANEIEALRSQRDSINLVELNLIKEEKSGQEVRRWGFNCRDASIEQRKSKISTSIGTIQSID
jgi:hypothetical protein